MGQAKIKLGERVYRVEPGRPLDRVLRELGILPTTVIALKGGKLVPLRRRLEPDEEIELVYVVSGG
jgi:sulfur carrier protein ThiS